MKASYGLVSALAALGTAALGCDSSAAPAKSRVQAVLAEAAGAPGTAPPPPAQITPTPEPAPPRPPLCEGQLASKPKPFKPALAPRQLAREGDKSGELPEDPLKAARGHWLWLNFWAAWCVPCREELPLLFEWQQKLGERVSFAFFSLDDDERQLSAFLDKQPAAGLTRTQWLPDGAVRKAWLEALGLDTEPELPFQALIDPDGMLRCTVGGAVEAKDLPVLEQIVSARSEKSSKTSKKKKK
ncbi:MAG TPA: TlpA disulfide reductase family protein [Polyangiaceae bacterium]|nr:TlpA disulfide reductase family protein [Polyangiaceae bacterium]